MKLEEYHQCQPVILDAAKKAGGATQVPSSSGARGVTATATLTKRVAAKGAATVKSAIRGSESEHVTSGESGDDQKYQKRSASEAQHQAQMHQQQRQMDQAVEPAEANAINRDERSHEGSGGARQ